MSESISTTPAATPAAAPATAPASSTVDPPRLFRVPRGQIVAVICGALLLVFGVVSYSAVLKKSATFDEPFHAVAGYTHRFMNDYRIDPEDPALFGRYAALPFSADSLKIDTESVTWKDWAANDQNPWALTVGALYRTPGNDGIGFVNRSRFMFVLVGIALGAVIAYWAWELAGGVAAVVATALYALDPNFLAHAALVKNDVPTALIFLATSLLLWKLGRGGQWYWLLLLAVACGVGVGIKYSGVLLGPVVLVVLLVRAIARTPWTLCGVSLHSRPRRLGGVGATLAVVAVVSYSIIWASYGFRFAATADGQLHRTERMVEQLKIKEAWVRSPDPMRFDQSTFDRSKARLSALPAILLWAEEHRLLPQSWIAGFLFTYSSTLVRWGYLLGEIRLTGWWYYFPLAMAFKTPSATLAAIGVSSLLLASGLMPLLLRRWNFVDGWGWVCLATAPAVYVGSALLNNLNLGLRHVLPLYPFLFILAGLAAVVLVRLRERAALGFGTVLLFGLIAEMSLNYPNYLSFFNAPSGGSRGGFNLLSDSNLDWGQDLPLLADWQKRNPDKTLYLLYFGTADPAAYGIKGIHLPGGWALAPVLDKVANDLQSPGVIAAGATNVHGLYLPPDVKQAYKQVLRSPVEILGGSIYLYEFPPHQ